MKIERILTICTYIIVLRIIYAHVVDTIQKKITAHFLDIMENVVNPMRVLSSVLILIKCSNYGYAYTY